ncbi:MAG: PEP-CTERM/exosortase system-associated acyltransferase [Alphaproteobacteria bacterium]
MATEAQTKRRGRKPLLPRHSAPQELADHYHQYFDAMPALPGPMLNEAFRLRYRVLCDERQILKAKAYPDHMESDEFDAHAMHAVLRYRPDNSLVATMRVIFPDAGVTLPVFARAPQLHDDIDMRAAVELSRFIVARDFRRRWNDGYYGEVSEWLAGDNQRRIPHMALGLMRVALEFIQGRGVTHVAALAEPALLKMFEGLGFHFAPVGGLVECHGLRQPCYAKVESLLRRIKTERPEIWYYITDSGRFG